MKLQRSMGDIEQRLERVFGIVFPDIPPGKIRTASQNTVENWDSVASITLMNLIEEEFGIEMELDDIVEMTSFSIILDTLKGKVSDTAA